MTWEGLTPPYRTIVADPPWAYPDGFPTQPRTPGQWQGATKTKPLPYSAMTVRDIASLPVFALAARDSRLFLWATNRYLPDAFRIAAEWEFDYRQTLVWHKTDANMGGSVAPNSAEFLIVAVRGKPAVTGRMPSSVIQTSQPKRHSTKPRSLLDYIEAVSPGPYVELFCRQPRFGWDSWGHGYENFEAAL